MKQSLLSLLFASVALSGNAQTLVTDLRPGSAGSNPNYSVVVKNKLFFVANDGSTGKELFSYDGVNAPSLVYDLFPGVPHGVDTPVAALIDFRMGVLNDKIYFSGNDGTKGAELYSYDGASPSPFLASDIYTGTTSSAPTGFITYNNQLYFAATSASFGRELFSYDGSTANVIDIFPGLESSNPVNVALCNNKFYFSTQSFTDGIEPYEYDPATGNSKRLADINTGTDNSFPCYFTAFGGKVYFIAFEYQHGYELYSYNGTNVTRLTDVVSGNGAGVVNMFVYNNTLMLSASTDGSTYQLHTFDPATNKVTPADAVNGPSALTPNNFFVYNSKLYFAASDPSLGRELFMYDGTTISMAADINPGSGSGSPSDFAILNGQLTFTADNGTAGRELFKMGTATGIEQVSFRGSAVAYPNPAAGDCSLKLTLKEASIVKLVLSDATGKVVYSTAPQQFPASTSTILIPVQRFAAGNYFYQLYNEAGRPLTGGKLVKQY